MRRHVLHFGGWLCAVLCAVLMIAGTDVPNAVHEGWFWWLKAAGAFAGGVAAVLLLSAGGGGGKDTKSNV